MKRSKPLKLAIAAVLIFTAIVFVTWAVFFLVFTIGDHIFTRHFVQTLKMFNPFVLNLEFYLPLSITVLFLTAFIFVRFLLMLVFSIIKRRGIMVLPYFMVLFTGMGLMELVANFTKYTLVDSKNPVGYLYYIADKVDISKKIMAIAIMVCIIIAFILANIAFIMSLVHTIAFKNSRCPEVDDRLDETKVEPECAPADVNHFLPEPEPERPASDTEQLLGMIKDLIHELKGGNNQPPVNNTVTGATFSAPLVVQYFNGNTPVDAKQEEKKSEPVKEPELEEVVEPELIPDEPVKEEKPAPAPVKREEPKPEPQPEPEPEPQPEPEPEPVVEEPVPEPAPEPVVEEKAKIIRIPFEERITTAEKEMKDNYNELKNDIMAYGVKSRVSNSGDTFRLHRKTYVKLTIAGKSLKLYFALNPDDYKDSTLPIQDASEKNIYAEIPLVFKVKSGLSMRRAKQLVADVMAQDGLVQGEVGKVNWVKEIAIAMKEGKKASSDDDDE